MESWNIVLIDQTADHVVPHTQLQPIAAALQQQVDNDFAPVWGVRADISAPAPGDAIPSGAWEVRIIDSLPEGGGVHLDDQGQPYAEAVNGSDLSLAISHEVLEMLVDPYGNRFALGPDIDPNFADRQVFYLVEVCDPCEVSSYAIGDVQVSNFVLPSFYDPDATSAVDFRKTLAGPLPLKVPDGCYISWIDPADWKWHQQTTDGLFETEYRTPTDRNPRAARDEAFPDDDKRHNLQEICKRWRPAR